MGPTIGAMKSIIGAQALVLCIDVLTLAWLALATRTSQVDVVVVKTGYEQRRWDANKNMEVCEGGFKIAIKLSSKEKVYFISTWSC